jgi:ABC-2 type transport system permease protein
MSEITAASYRPSYRLSYPLSDSLTMAARCFRMTRRQLDALMMSLLLPVMLMVTFVYLFGGAISTGTKYITYVVPGILVLCSAVGSAKTAMTVAQDMTGGIIDRFRSLDVGGAPVLAGHVAASVGRNIASTVLVLGVAFGIGFRPHAGVAAWLAMAGILLLFVLAASWLSAAFGLLVKSPEAADGFVFLLMFLTYASSAFVPVRTMPTWMRGFADYQPATPVIETIRGLLLGTPVGASPWRAAAWCGGILVVSIAASACLFRRRTT